MFNNIEIYAGKNARNIILDRGFKAEDVKAMAGSAGGPKFLILNGLDQVIFGEMFKKRKEKLFYIGSSIGAFRGTALAQKNPLESLEKLTESYLKQSYREKPSRRDVSADSERIIDDYLDKKGADYILNKSYMHLNIIAAKCDGISASDNSWLLPLFLLNAVAVNSLSRNALLKLYERVIFTDTREEPPFLGHFKNPELRVPLTRENLRSAVLASGAIPFAMDGVRNIKGAPAGTYRDGGVTDYHMDIDFGVKDGLVLFPHFFSRIIPGWFDKAMKWRKPDPENLANTLMVCPSREFIRKLSGGRIPDRKDFKTFFGNDKERLKNWNYAINESRKCGEDFFEAVESGRIKGILKDF